MGEQELLADAVCVALNVLPAHYVRHDVDLGMTRISLHVALRQRLLSISRISAV
jgi:hypothetical protein